MNIQFSLIGLLIFQNLFDLAIHIQVFLYIFLEI